MHRNFNLNRDLLKKNHASDLNKKTREGRIDQFVEKVIASKKFENTQSSKTSAVQQSKLQMSATSYPSSASYTGRLTNQEKNAVYKPNAFGLKQSDEYDESNN